MKARSSRASQPSRTQKPIVTSLTSSAALCYLWLGAPDLASQMGALPSKIMRARAPVTMLPVL